MATISADAPLSRREAIAPVGVAPDHPFQCARYTRANDALVSGHLGDPVTGFGFSWLRRQINRGGL
jgi:hypothetical protein